MFVDNKDTIKEITELLNNPQTSPFLDVKSPRETIQNALQFTETKIADCSQKAKEYESNLKTLGGPPQESEVDIENLKYIFDNRKKLWDNLINYERENTEWKRKSLVELLDINIEDKMKNYQLIGLELDQKLSENTIPCFFYIFILT